MALSAFPVRSRPAGPGPSAPDADAPARSSSPAAPPRLAGRPGGLETAWESVRLTTTRLGPRSTGPTCRERLRPRQPGSEELHGASALTVTPSRKVASTGTLRRNRRAAHEVKA